MGAGAVLVTAACVQTQRSAAEAQAAIALERYVQLMIRQDAVALSAMFLPAGTIAHEGQAAIVGPEAIRKFLDSFANYKVLDHAMVITSAAVEGAGLRQDGTYRQRVRTPDGQTIEVNGRFTAKWVRQTDGRWLIESMLTAPPKA